MIERPEIGSTHLKSNSSMPCAERISRPKLPQFRQLFPYIMPSTSELGISLSSGKGIAPKHVADPSYTPSKVLERKGGT